MTVVRLKGLKRYRHPVTGKWYTYHRATGARLKAEFGTPEFLAELAGLESAKPPEPKPGTIAMALDAYRRSPAWENLRPATRLSYDRGFNAIANKDAVLLTDLSRPVVVDLQEKMYRKHGRWMANYVVTVLVILCDYAIDRGWLATNPAKDVKRLRAARDTPRANRPWSREESRTVLNQIPPYLRVPVALAMYTGLRKSDVLSITKDAICDNGVIRLTTAKRGVKVAIPMHPDLLQVLARAPQHQAETIAANMAGASWTVSGFNSTFIKAIGRLEERGLVAAGLTMHGLRHTLGTRLREAGAELDDIRRILGQKTLAMAQHYSETADTTERARGVIGKLDLTGADQRAAVSTHSENVSTPDDEGELSA